MQADGDVFAAAAGVERVEELSRGAPNQGNSLVQGDNAEVLDAMIGDQVTGEVRCVYIDPPYNNQERYTHFDDRLNHSEWLAQLGGVLERLWRVLRSDGSLWVSIDDSGLHYLKVMADEVVGRHSFVTTIVWEHRTTRENRRVFSNNHEYLLVYAKNPDEFKVSRNALPLNGEVLARYANPDGDPRGPWQSISANVQAGHGTAAQFYELTAPNGRTHRPPHGRCWVYSIERMREEIGAGNIWFGKDGDGVPRIKQFLAERTGGLTPETLWTADAVGTTLDAKRQLLELFPDVPVFDTPKPETLLKRVLHIATDPGDLVLDAYLGSGTTAAVAHKMGRRWIGIEVGEHAATLCATRLGLVLDGETSGISRELEWKGGGGFDFYRTAPQLQLAASALASAST